MTDRTAIPTPQRLRGGMWLDTATGEREPADLLVVGGRLVADDGREASESDLTGCTVLYGPWDCHVHPGEDLYGPDGGEFLETSPARTIRAGENLRAAVAAGITGVRCVDEADDIDLEYAQAIEAGRFAGPRVRGTGRALRATGGHGTFYPKVHAHVRSMHVIDGPVAASRAVREQVERGAHWIKVMLTGGLASRYEEVDQAQLTDEELAAVVTTAAQRGLPVAAHCGGAGPAIRFAQLGGRSIEHGYALTEEAVAAMAAHGTWLVPTIGVTHDPSFLAEGDNWPDFSLERAEASRARHAESLAMARAAGVRLAVGADLNPIAERFHAELALLEEAGMPRREVLHAATVGGRAMNGFQDASAPEPGAVADLVAVEGDPMADPRVLAEPALVLVGGAVRVSRRAS
ncbi:MAG: amidohydrolase family protein [Nitriliruptoraceae bacterium]